MTAVEFSPQERARLDAIEAAEPAPESLRERVARATYDAVRIDAQWWELDGWMKDRYRAIADAALAVIKGDPS